MRRIGKYELRGLLGRGGMGKVYKARVPVLGKLVALKVLEPWELTEDLLGTATVRELFRKEAQALASLRHPHLAEILDFDSDVQGRPFFTQEFYCRHLGLVLGEQDPEAHTVRVLPPERAVRYALEIAAALQRLHSAGIIHRDIKPANILLDDHDQVKLIDLGLSLLPEKAPVFPEQFKVGTPLYAAPEQEHNPASVTASADLYSLGVCLWRMLLGSFPAGAQTQSVFPSQLRFTLGSCWDRVLTKAVAAEPELRYQSTDHLCADVQEALACWRESQLGQCKLPETATADTVPVNKVLQPRGDGAKVPRIQAQGVFGLDAKGRPLAYPEHNFVAEAQGQIRDILRGRIWEQSGSEYPLTRQEARTYVHTRNTTSVARAAKWRLPTVNELLTLIVPPDSARQMCQSPLFDADRCQLWSADWRTQLEGWYVDTELGFVASQDKHCRCFVRLVRESGER